jgi:hypothetical protein
LRFYSSSSLKFVPLAAIVIFNIISQFGECIFDCLDKTETARDAAAKADDSVALGEIVGNGKNFTIFGEPMGCAFNHLVGGLAGFRV